MTTIPAAYLRSLHLALDPMGRPSNPLLAVDLNDVDWGAADLLSARLAGIVESGPAPVLIGLASAPLPVEAASVVKQLTVTLGGGLDPWCIGSSGDLGQIAETVSRSPLASLAFDQVVRSTSRASVHDGLLIESLAYSMLLAAPEFTAWRAATPHRTAPAAAEPVAMAREGSTLQVTLNRPERHNAFGHAVRDGLLEALELARLDDSIREVVVRGAGPSYCSGGDLDEFGTSPDVASAHLIRLSHSVGRAVVALGDRVTFEVHGACIGAGIEIPAFAPTVTARDGAQFRLPELRMGLIPGAGGTVSLTHRIGRWRTAWLALTGQAIDTETAVAWGLVDERV